MHLNDGIGIGGDLQVTRSMSESVRKDIRLRGCVIKADMNS